VASWEIDIAIGGTKAEIRNLLVACGGQAEEFLACGLKGDSAGGIIASCGRGQADLRFCGWGLA
jgi:hypothetical protein